MIERHHPQLSVGAQCRLLSISRSSFYYAPRGESVVNLALMRLIDRRFLETSQLCMIMPPKDAMTELSYPPKIGQ